MERSSTEIIAWVLAAILLRVLWPVASFMYKEGKRVKLKYQEMNKELFWYNIQLLAGSPTIFGLGAKELIKEKESITEECMHKTIYDLQKNIRENEPFMMGILGETFSYFNNYKIGKDGKAQKETTQTRKTDEVFNESPTAFLQSSYAGN